MDNFDKLYEQELETLEESRIKAALKHGAAMAVTGAAVGATAFFPIGSDGDAIPAGAIFGGLIGAISGAIVGFIGGEFSDRYAKAKKNLAVAKESGDIKATQKAQEKLKSMKNKKVLATKIDKLLKQIKDTKVAYKKDKTEATKKKLVTLAGKLKILHAAWNKLGGFKYDKKVKLDEPENK